MKVSLIVFVALIATALLRNRSAAVRHWVLAAAIALAAGTPVLERVVPSWDVRAETATARLELAQSPADTLPIPPRASADRDPLAVARRWLRPVWIAGLVLNLAVLFAGFARITWLAARSRRLVQGTWASVAAEISRACGSRRTVRLLQSDRPTLLVTWGWIRPRIMLPRGAGDWPESRVRIVLSHELAHIRRADWVVQMAAELVRSVYWFNPLLWIACGRLRQESEYACDDAVLNLGVEGTEYATHLLEVARSFRRHGTILSSGSPALAIARPSTLERRVRAMLNSHLNRTPITRFASIAVVILLLGVAVPIAGFGAGGQGAQASFAGSLMDTIGRVMPNVPVTLTNVDTSAKHQARSDFAGHFEFTGLPAGTYMLDAEQPGFSSRYRLALGAGQRLQSDVTLQVGTVQETITIVGGSDSRPRTAQVRSPISLPPYRPELDPCSQSTVGGCILPPTKIRDVKPEYPASRAGADSIVLLEGRIGTDGFISGLRLTAAVDEEFAKAAVTAVNQWQFTPTRLGGVPIETAIKITANFRAQ